MQEVFEKIIEQFGSKINPPGGADESLVFL